MTPQTCGAHAGEQHTTTHNTTTNNNNNDRKHCTCIDIKHKWPFFSCSISTTNLKWSSHSFLKKKKKKALHCLFVCFSLFLGRNWHPSPSHSGNSSPILKEEKKKKPKKTHTQKRTKLFFLPLINLLLSSLGVFYYFCLVFLVVCALHMEE